MNPSALPTLIHTFTVWARHCPKLTLSISDLHVCRRELRVWAERSVLLSGQRKILVPVTLQNSGTWYHLSEDRSPCKTCQKWLQLSGAFLLGPVSSQGWAEACSRRWMFTGGLQGWPRVNPMKSNPNKRKKHTSTRVRSVTGPLPRPPQFFENSPWDKPSNVNLLNWSMSAQCSTEDAGSREVVHLR